MYHMPVLLHEAVTLLVTDPQGYYVDGTLGGGGHAQAILETLARDGKVVGIDQDMDAIRYSRKRLKPFAGRFIAIHHNFAALQEVLLQHDIASINGLLLDLGISSHQLDEPDRGFSFDRSGALDMRMSRATTLTAAEIVNTFSEREIADLIYRYGEERQSFKIARAIVAARRREAIATTDRLKTVIAGITGYQRRAKTLARVFQALRIAVNDELNRLETTLRQSLSLLVPGGRIVVISYHSLEDRICKEFFRAEASRCICPPELPACVCAKKNRLRVLTKRPLTPKPDEISGNPRSRSARLRAAEFIG